MSATAVLDGRVHYKDQLKLQRASTAAEWTAEAFAWAFDAIRAEPGPAEWIDEVTPRRPRYYGAFY
jgi:hypothetical protein